MNNELATLSEKQQELRGELRKLSKRMNRIKAINRYYETHKKREIRPLSRKGKTADEFRLSVNEYQRIRMRKKKLFDLQRRLRNRIYYHI